MTKELKNRIITSIFLVGLLIIAFSYSYILLISLIVVSLISWIEFSALISKIFIKKSYENLFIKFLINILCLSYLVFFSFLLFDGIASYEFKLIMVYLFSVCIFSDIGGLIFGKIFKGKKLTKISPKKTVSGSLGSFILSLSLTPFFYIYFKIFSNPFDLIILTIIVSFSCQLGDLFISYLKRKAKVKDTSDLLPGHGGVLDRIDGILFAIPVGTVLSKFLITIL
jgi:phosphatidate cytidylyltransferase